MNICRSGRARRCDWRAEPALRRLAAGGGSVSSLEFVSYEFVGRAMPDVVIGGLSPPYEGWPPGVDR